MENKHQFFYIPRHLDRGKTTLGLPSDEIVPAIGLLVLLFASRHEVLALIACVVWFVGLRQIKRQYGDKAILLMCYWYGNKPMSESMFPCTPPSQKRYWLK
ncbi:type IV conjugative transfer system protein TraL [Vibrio cyclitrophicus]|uniref:Protein TraL n=2 Tax=Vibrio cyclitrophicus TaxID=47951 RepID=A0A7Z1MKE6_9VIBR|nr:type IV conjugative transfer system protein TraL [Vibrio cyclitrophicus]PMP21130.1 type IV conjugative transfer system protein TraL [Vibrio cyclitrophicus]PMP30523.1 type IV conjugative transfer system protein TraL [Vibrio cyclitrophicus]